MLLTLSLLSGYIIGSFPTGYILTKFVTKKDIRITGSCSTGATNVLRTSGNKKLALLTLLTDLAKGFIVSRLFINTEYLSLAVMACIIGHAYPIWLKGHGGKGVATAAGALLGICPYITIISAGIWATVLKLTKTSSVASLSFIVSFLLLALLTNSSKNLIILSVLILGFLLCTHRDNLLRLIKNKENTIDKW